MDESWQLWQLEWFQDKKYNVIFVQSVKTLLLQRPLLVCSVALILWYFLWYWLYAVRKPLVYCGNGKLRDFFLARCPALTECYRPTWWAVNCHICTIVRPKLQKSPKNIKYERHTITLPDGGILAVDFSINNSLNPLSPILLILPGVTGDSYMNYVIHFVNDALRAGYRPAVFNQRGTGGLPLKTARMFSATNTEDLESTIDYINGIYPGARIVALGVSLGGIILSHYLSNTGRDCGLSAAITFSTPLHIASSLDNLENRWFNQKAYVTFLINNLLRIVKSNSKVIQRHPSIDFKKLCQASNFTEFDSAMTVHIFGYKSVVDYYADACLVEKLDKIKIPYLALISSDDPFIPSFSVPVDKFTDNPNTLLVITKHGGHFGFLEGSFPFGKTWMNKLNQQFLDALKVYCKT